jgi:hypothetical protein
LPSHSISAIDPLKSILEKSRPALHFEDLRNGQPRLKSSNGLLLNYLALLLLDFDAYESTTICSVDRKYDEAPCASESWPEVFQA